MKQLIVILFVCAWIVACATSYPPAPLFLPLQSTTLQPGDQIRLIIFGENELSGLYNVDQQGQITLPLVGSISVSGQTADQSAEHIRSLLKQDYLRDPKVAVSIERQRDVYILGEVQRPGNYSYSPHLTVLQAVAKAGGYSYRANEKYMVVRRADNQQPEQIKRYQATEDTPLMPGDSVTVEERYF